MVGSPDAVRAGLKAIIADTGADELMLTAQIYDHAARLRSFEIAADARGRLAAGRSAASLTTARESGDRPTR